MVDGSATLYSRFEVGQGSQSLLSKLCVHTIRIAQDLNTWTEYDPQSELAHDCNDSWWTDIPRLRENTALTKDAGLRSNFFHEFTLNAYDVEVSANGANERICAWAGSISLANQNFYDLPDFEVAALIVLATDLAGEYQLKLVEKGGNEDTMVTNWPVYQDRYIVIYKEGNKLIASSYQDAGHQVGEDSAEITLSGDLQFRYISMPMSFGQLGAQVSSGYLDPIFGSMEFLSCNFISRHDGAPVELLGKFEVGQGSAELLGRGEVQHTGTPVELLGKTDITHSVKLLGKAEVQQSRSAELLSNFRVTCPRRMGGNWQRKMWFDDTYYWRGRYDSVADEIIFEYIAAAGLAGNTWTKNGNASIDASVFSAGAIIADFTVRGAEFGIKTTIHYSDGVDTWVAESNEASLTGWAWQNLTKVFDGTAPDSYRRVNLNANRKAVNPILWATAVFVDDSESKQWVQTSEQSNSGDITAWDAAVAVSNVNNTNKIYGCSSRSMGATGAEVDDVMWVYKEGDALRSRYFTGAAWQAIQDVDTDTYSGKAIFDFEHGEIMGEKEGHVVYVDADGTVKWRERPAGAVVAWEAVETLDTGTTDHGGVGIVEHGSGWLWVIWKEANVLQFRVHNCLPEIWYPLLANEPLTFDVSSQAVVTTSTVTQPNTSDNIPSGEAVPICWVGETAPATPCEVGWGILVEYSIGSLTGILDVRQLTSTDLYARLEVGQGSAELLGKGVIRQPGSTELLGKGIIRHSDIAELLGKVEVQHLGSAELLGEAKVQHSGSAELLGKFEAQATAELLGRAVIRHVGTPVELLGKAVVRHVGIPVELLGKAVIRHSDTAELLGKAVIRHSDTAELLGKIEVRQPDSAELLGKGVIRHQVFAELLGKTVIRHVGTPAELLGKVIIRHSDTAELLGKTVIQHVGTPAELLGKAVIRHSDTTELLGKGIIRHSDTAELLGKTVIRHSDTTELLGKGIIRHTDIRELVARCVIRHSASKDLDADVEIVHWEVLFGKTKIRHTAMPLDFPAIFWVRWPSRLWTSRRYINGVIELDEKLLGDAILEYVIEGVMEDTQGYLDNAGLSYSEWTDITLVPVQILRAVTYGTVASLYARHTQTFRSQVIPSITPVTVTVIGDAEKAMNYWEDRMNQMLEFYVTSQGGDVMLTSTPDEEPVFSMEDIPEEVTEFVSWRIWLQERGN